MNEKDRTSASRHVEGKSITFFKQAQSNEERSEKRADSKYVHTSLDNVEPNKKVDELDSNPSDVSGRHQKFFLKQQSFAESSGENEKKSEQSNKDALIKTHKRSGGSKLIHSSKQNETNANTSKKQKLNRKLWTTGSIVRNVPAPAPDVKDSLPRGNVTQQEDNNERIEGELLFGDEPSSAVRHYFGKVLRSISLDSWISTGYQSLSNTISENDNSNESSVCECDNPEEQSPFQYDCSYPERGCFLIFDQENFDEKLELPKRYGTSKDANRLKLAAEHLGFEYVEIVKDSRKLDILNIMDSVASADHSSYDCFACAILTHGGDKDALFASDQTFHLKELTRAITADKCPSLAGKPKLFFVQACRGVKLDEGARNKVLKNDPNKYEVDGPIPYISPKKSLRESTCFIPVEADFLIAQSTAADYYSWRNTHNGSVFIQALCACFFMYGEKMEIMQRMFAAIHQDFASILLRLLMGDRKGKRKNVKCNRQATIRDSPLDQVHSFVAHAPPCLEELSDCVLEACDAMRLHTQHLNIFDILTRVNRMVAYDFESSTKNPSMDKKKQIPSITSRLTAEMYFFKKTSSACSVSS